MDNDTLERLRMHPVCQKQPSCLPVFLVLLCSYKHSCAHKACKREQLKAAKENDIGNLTEVQVAEYKNALRETENFMKALVPFVLKSIVGRSHLTNLIRLAWGSWNGFSTEYDPIIKEEDMEARKARRSLVAEEAHIKCRRLESTMAMMITQQSPDEKVQTIMMQRITPGFTDATSYLNVLKFLDFNEFFELLIELTRDSSMYCTKAKNLLMLWVVSEFMFDNDVPMDDYNLMGFPQIGTKKGRIIANMEVDSENPEAFKGVGPDIHVQDLVKALIRQLIPKLAEYPAKYMDKYVDWICDEMAVDPGIYFNEFAGEIRQSGRGTREWMEVIDQAIKAFVMEYPKYKQITLDWLRKLDSEEEEEKKTRRENPPREARFSKI